MTDCPSAAGGRHQLRGRAHLHRDLRGRHGHRARLRQGTARQRELHGHHGAGLLRRRSGAGPARRERHRVRDLGLRVGRRRPAQGPCTRRRRRPCRRPSYDQVLQGARRQRRRLLHRAGRIGRARATSAGPPIPAAAARWRSARQHLRRQDRRVRQQRCKTALATDQASKSVIYVAGLHHGHRHRRQRRLHAQGIRGLRRDRLQPARSLRASDWLNPANNCSRLQQVHRRLLHPGDHPVRRFARRHLPGRRDHQDHRLGEAGQGDGDA